MKKLVYLLVIAGLFPFLAGCDDFLDVSNYTVKDESSYPKTEADALEMLNGVYSRLNRNAAVGSSYYNIGEMLSDQRFGGGGMADRGNQAHNQLMYTSQNQINGTWTSRYTSIAYANAALAALANMDEGTAKDQKIGEAKVMLALWYFELVQLLGDIPLMKRAPENLEEAKTSPPPVSQEEIYKFIAQNLWDAYNSMPECQWNTYPSGTITKWAAAGMLARVYLFYTGFYQKAALPLEDGGQITGTQIATALEDCITKSEHSLVPDFRSLWAYTNSVTKPDYPFAVDAPTWVRDGENPEHVFVIKMKPHSTYNSTISCNEYQLYYAPRQGGGTDYKKLFPLGLGWGHGPVNSKLWDDWAIDEPNDIRRKASIWNYKEETLFVGTGADRVEVPAESYYESQWGADRMWEETGMWQKKMVATRAYKPDGNSLYYSFMSAPEYFNYVNDNFQQGHGCDFIFIRFADILLMHSEITQTADGLNKVRARVNLPPVAYSIEAIQKERRYELAFEGVRWGDMRRWHIADVMLDRMYGVVIRNDAVPTVMKKQSPWTAGERYRETNGFLQVPLTQRELAGKDESGNDILKQNKGWPDIPELLFTQWVDN